MTTTEGPTPARVPPGRCRSWRRASPGRPRLPGTRVDGQSGGVAGPQRGDAEHVEHAAGVAVVADQRAAGLHPAGDPRRGRAGPPAGCRSRASGPGRRSRRAGAVRGQPARRAGRRERRVHVAEDHRVRAGLPHLRQLAGVGPGLRRDHREGADVAQAVAGRPAVASLVGHRPQRQRGPGRRCRELVDRRDERVQDGGGERREDAQRAAPGPPRGRPWPPRGGRPRRRVRRAGAAAADGPCGLPHRSPRRTGGSAALGATVGDHARPGHRPCRRRRGHLAHGRRVAPAA